MSNYSHEIVLDYNQIYSYHPKYKHFYFDFLNKNLKNNTSVIYAEVNPSTKESVLCLGLIVTKDHVLFETKEGTITKVTLKSVPFIRTNNGTLLINTGSNCASI